MEISIPIPSSFFFNLLLLASLLISSAFAIDPFTEALLSFKSELIDNSNTLSDWYLPSGFNPSSEKIIYACSWSGVTCNNNSTMVNGLDLSMENLVGAISGKQFSVFTDLISLNLSFNSLSKQLPVGIFNLSSLRSLDISRNNFSGHFPSGISNLKNLVVFDAFSNSFSGPVPAEISELQFLKVLNLAGSYFSGPIPSEYGSFKSLEFIHLAGNLLSGDIPQELGQLQTVTHMEIGYNSYQGSLPWQFGNMSELQYLDVAGANLSGTIPNQLSNLTKLHTLFLFRNQLSGLIPWELGEIISLTNLDLSDNLLSGPIPQSFSVLENLRLLSLMYNYMNGSVPEGIAQLPSLDTLLIWNNFFDGSLPESLGKYSKLKWLDVSTNDLIGGIPPGICSGGVLTKLILFSNNFSGEISPLANCSSLVRLRIEDNSFSGKIPLEFSNLPGITYVDMSRNRFSGGIPIDISQATKLEYWNVSNNPEIGGVLPEETWSLPLLQNFSAFSCNITGNLPEFQSCKSLSVIELNTNKLLGTIPESISKCQVLEKVDLANNNFSGNLPEQLSILPALAILDLSHNRFSGPIPGYFTNSSNLVLLNVSFNEISGPIPSEKRFRSMGRSAFIGNPELCGAPLQPCTRMPRGLQLGIRRTQRFAWVLIVCALVGLCLSVSFIAIFYLRRRSREQWRVVSFSGLPKFKPKDVLRSFITTEAIGTVPTMSVQKVVLPTGLTVSVKKIEVDEKNMKPMLELMAQAGNARHKNLVRLLGFCYSNNVAYLLFDYLPNGNLLDKTKMKRDWVAKYKIVMGIARGLCFLHHDCYPAIPHGDLRTSNIVFDESMEPHLTEYGIKQFAKRQEGTFPAATSRIDTGEQSSITKDEIYMDIYNFGELILEVLTNGKLTNAGRSTQGKPMERLLGDICQENEVGSTDALREDIKLVLEVALLCTRSRPCDRPTMEEVLKLLSGLKPNA